MAVDRTLVDRLISEYEALGRTVKEIDAAVPRNGGTTVRLSPPGNELQNVLDSMHNIGGTIILQSGDYPISPRITTYGRLISIQSDGPVSLRGFTGAIRSGNIAFNDINFINPIGSTHITLGADRLGLTRVEDIPQDFSFVNCNMTGPCKRGMAANCDNLLLDNCEFTNYFIAGQDSQALAGWNGARNHRLLNSTFEAASENIGYGGDDAALEDLYPTNIYVENCLFTKKREWKEQRYNMKCAVETKNVIGMTMKTCTILGCYQQAWGNAPAIVIKASNQNGRNPTARTENFILEDCYIEDVGTYLVIIGRNDGDHSSGICRNIFIRNNIFRLMNNEPDGRALRIGDGPERVIIDHNTFYDNKHSMVEYWGTPMTDVRYMNNIVNHGTYGVFPMPPTNPLPFEMFNNAIQINPNRRIPVPESNVYYDNTRTADLTNHVTTDGLPVGSSLTLK